MHFCAFPKFPLENGVSMMQCRNVEVSHHVTLLL